MNKKIFLSILPILAIFILVGAGCAEQIGMTYKDAPEVISQEEQDFNNSGQAKAIENATDLWRYYENEEVGFSFNYPHDVAFGDEDSESVYNLTVEVDLIDGLGGTMGYNEETALSNITALANGEYGEGVDSALVGSEKIKSMGEINGQEFMVLGRFEVCDVRFERKLYFLKDGYQVVLTLTGDKDALVRDSQDYFKTDADNCGEEKIWDFDKQTDFYTVLIDGDSSEMTQRWFTVFDEITGTIKFLEDDVAEETDAVEVTP